MGDITSLHRAVFAHSGSLGIGVIKQFRGKGIGEALIRVALAQAKIKVLTRVELTVHEHNQAAISLYEKLGFFIEGKKIRAVKVDNVYEDLICMAVLLEE